MEDNIDYGALFGINEGGNEQEVADPAAGAEGAQGAEEQEVADPAGTQQEAGEPQENDQEEGGDDDAENNTQTPEERKRFAAARRKAEAERDAAIERAKKDAQEAAQKTIDEAFANSGLTNPYTKKPITSKAEYDEYRARFEAERKARVMKKSGMSDEEFDRFVESLPEVQRAKAAQQQAEQAAAQAREKQAKLNIEEQVRKISALDPTIKSLEDITKMETYPQFYEMVKEGLSLERAFKLANFETLTGKAAAASRQAAINAAQGKSHLSQTATRGAGAVSVPAEVKEAYRAFNPNATDAEIQQHYNKYMKK